MRVNKATLLRTLPPEWPEDLLPSIQQQIKESNTKVVVLDDDPTGTQTVHDVPVLTEWSTDALHAVLSEPEALVFILTNSRSVSLLTAQAMNREIAAQLTAAREATGRPFVVVSRSDSTLRGHYPGEITALAEALNHPFDGTLIIPCFFEGGRLTLNDIHSITEGEWLIPAAETEYARDATFGYTTSNLREWVSEKHHGQIAPQAVVSIPVADLRSGGPTAVATLLDRVRGGRVAVVNAATYRDLEVFVAGLLQAEAAGQRFLYRTAASFVRVRGGVAPRPQLTAADLAAPGKAGGLIVAGSYIKQSTMQLERVQALPQLTSLEVSVGNLLQVTSAAEEIKRIADLANASLAAGKDTLISTSRGLITGSDARASLHISQTVSAALVTIVQGITEQPAWIIAKGGITSSDIATKGLQLKRAQVLGQALPGVPIWRTGGESRWPGLIYVVFPGNVGGPEAIVAMIQTLRGEGGRPDEAG
ncbi:MAG TPA: four-carbon acid sugar kinase family protein [Herpetosiphonaceae bacterium]|nr:four-carbon acid sugar kinase family protein [Herpetosiphonaceae bacterium]